jgi:hypothetical protein
LLQRQRLDGGAVKSNGWKVPIFAVVVLDDAKMMMLLLLRRSMVVVMGRA